MADLNRSEFDSEVVVWMWSGAPMALVLVKISKDQKRFSELQKVMGLDAKVEWLKAMAIIPQCLVSVLALRTSRLRTVHVVSPNC